jgi:hypothetical protein
MLKEVRGIDILNRGVRKRNAAAQVPKNIAARSDVDGYPWRRAALASCSYFDRRSRAIAQQAADLAFRSEVPRRAFGARREWYPLSNQAPDLSHAAFAYTWPVLKKAFCLSNSEVDMRSGTLHLSFSR